MSGRDGAAYRGVLLRVAATISTGAGKDRCHCPPRDPTHWACHLLECAKVPQRSRTGIYAKYISIETEYLGIVVISRAMSSLEL